MALVSIVCFSAVSHLRSFLYFADNLLNFEESLRVGLFQTVSMITNTGIQFESYLNWPVGAQAILFLALFMGLVLVRVLVGMRMQQLVVMAEVSLFIERRILQPMAIIPMRINGKTVGEDSFGQFLVCLEFIYFEFAGGFFLTILSDLDIFSAWQMVLICLEFRTGFGLSHNPAL